MASFVEKETEILNFWQKRKIFEKSLRKTKRGRHFVFYDGPPFATGLPHYGHILSSVAKDVFPRYKTMKGYFVARRWGWDCHGLPIENIVEKELGIKEKKEIETTLGIEKFNQACRSRVLTYIKEWKKMVDRIGRFIDFDNSYKTMDSTYMESVWWALKSLWQKGLIYEGRKVLLYCPRCQTPISKAEVAMDNSYQDITEEAVTVKFKVKKPDFYNLPSKTFLLAWTTTPWTLPANVALAVNKKIDYILVRVKDENYIVAKSRLKDVFEGREYEIIRELKGSQLVGIEYEPLYELEAVKETKNKSWLVLGGDFVSTEEGTGIVHTAVVYGEDDFKLGIKNKVAFVPLLDEKGVFNQKSPQFIQGKYFKDSEEIIKDDLVRRGLLFSKKSHTHSYPFCHRCSTSLFYNAISSWFINIQKHKKRIIALNRKINWYPKHLKYGRFLNILKEAPDWNISRNRYWATPLPFWKCKCGAVECIGSLKELKKRAVNFDKIFKSSKIKEVDLHKDKIDKIELRCKKCKGSMTRIPEVVDCWVESASMPFAELHYPFENKNYFKKRLPAHYIAEYIAQTRTWFYYLHVLAVLLFNKNSFENVVCTGTILNEKGEKLSKSKRNYTDPWLIINQYGADALRFYLTSSSVMEAEDLFFKDDEVREVYSKVINPLWNACEFYSLYSPLKRASLKTIKPSNLLDKWILSRLNSTLFSFENFMENYDVIKSCREIRKFIEDLSLWYIRRSRERFRDESGEKDKAASVLRLVLLEFSKAIAPILPFISEYIFQKVKGKSNEESVHLERWPRIDKKMIDKTLEKKMEKVREIVSLALAERISNKVKVRQPLLTLKVNSSLKIKEKDLIDLVREEVNVKNIVFDKTLKKDVELDLTITPELEEEGILRETIRKIQAERKRLGLKPKDKITIFLEGEKRVIELVQRNKSLLLKELKALEINTRENSEVKDLVIKVEKQE